MTLGEWVVLAALVGGLLWLYGQGVRTIYPEMYKRGRRIS